MVHMYPVPLSTTWYHVCNKNLDTYMKQQQNQKNINEYFQKLQNCSGNDKYVPSNTQYYIVPPLQQKHRHISKVTTEQVQFLQTFSKIQNCFGIQQQIHLYIAHVTKEPIQFQQTFPKKFKTALVHNVTLEKFSQT